MSQRALSAVGGLALLGALASCSSESSLDIEKALTPTGGGVFVQGWNAKERRAWSSASQGGRLIPLSWYKALEQADGSGLFSEAGYFSRFGYPRENSANGLPIGFAVDRQSDEKFRATKLRWYQGQTGRSAKDAEPWFGMTCGACHLSEIEYQGQRMRIYGGASMGDFQSFVKAMDRALVATQQDAEKWDRFAARVLEGRDTPENRALLKTAFAKLLKWQRHAALMNRTPTPYGYGRVDALGRLYNKMTQFSGSTEFAGNPPSAPVSYPFIWGVWKQKFVQWNGSARNTFVWRKNPRTPDVGAFGRNAGQAIGVFGEIVGDRKQSDGIGLVSSINTRNLISFENMISRLEAPRWPKFFPEIDRARAQRGKSLYAQHCNSCHLAPELQKKGEPTERMIALRKTSPANRTDTTMACNAFTYDVPTGELQGTRMGYLTGRRLGKTEPGFDMMYALVVGAAVQNVGVIGSGAISRWVDYGSQSLAGKAAGTGRTSRIPTSQRLQTCLTEKNDILGYKARPLDGIWATAPYLHNGSVPNLYEMLLPAAQRSTSFNLGSRQYDPEKVGYVTTPGGGNNFQFRVVDRAGRPLLGNSNAGHEYGTDKLSAEDRADLLEYLKTL